MPARPNAIRTSPSAPVQRKGLAALLVCSVCLLAAIAVAQVPKLIGLQGRLTEANGNPVADNVYPIKFEFFDSVGPGGGCLWEENQMVGVQGGLFSVQLGSVGQGIPDSAFNGDSRWLAITVGNDPEMTPRLRLTSGSYSYRVNSVEGASGGNIYGDLTLHSTFTTGDLLVTNKATIGPLNVNTGLYAFVAGTENTASANYAVVGGGRGNTASAAISTVGGGLDNTASHNFSMVGGGGNNTASGLTSTVSGGGNNTASGNLSTVAGGYNNSARDTGATVSGGWYNNARGRYAVVGGGGGADVADSNSALGEWSVVGGGTRNIASGDTATIGGGASNTAGGDGAIIGGGDFNTAAGRVATVAGGLSNIASGYASTVPGGYGNEALRDYSFAAGKQAKANHSGTFVWADGSGGNFASTATNQFLIRAAGGVGIGTTGPDVPLQVRNLADSGGMVRIGANAVATGVEKRLRFGDGDFVAIGEDSSTNDRMEIKAGTGGVFINTVAGIQLGAGVGVGTAPTSNWIQVSGGAYCDGPNWVSVSSRQYKTDIRPLDSEDYSEILRTLGTVDVVRFRYKRDTSREHIGLIAEDVPDEIASNDRMGIPPNDAIAFLMAALKAQQARIETLEKTVEQLTAPKDSR